MPPVPQSLDTDYLEVQGTYQWLEGAKLASHQATSTLDRTDLRPTQLKLWPTVESLAPPQKKRELRP